MNKIYKSIYNAARRCVVCVSEATSSAQGRKGDRVVSESQSLVKPFKKTVLAIALGMLGATGTFAGELVCAEGDMLCQTQRGVQPRAAYNLTVNEGETKEIVGERLTIASGGSVGIIANKGMLTIRDGATSAAYGIYYNANGSGSTGTISNTGSGTLMIQGGTETKTAIYYNAYNGGTAIIRNEGEGTFEIRS